MEARSIKWRVLYPHHVISILCQVVDEVYLSLVLFGHQPQHNKTMFVLNVQGRSGFLKTTVVRIKNVNVRHVLNAMMIVSKLLKFRSRT